MEPTAAQGLTIDVRLLLLQAGNFLVLFALLTWLVWKPLLQLVEQRRKTIADGLKAAEEQKAAAAKASEEREKLLTETRLEAQKLIEETRAELKKERDRSREELAADKIRILKAAEADILRHKEKIAMELKSQTVTLITQAVEKILGKTPDDTKRWQPVLEEVIKERV